MGRVLEWDWYRGTIPDNVRVHDAAYIETSFSFRLFRSQRDPGVSLDRGAHTYLGTMFDVGPDGFVSLGEYALVHGARIICDQRIEIGAYALISWNVVLMDTRRMARDVQGRRRQLQTLSRSQPQVLSPEGDAQPIRIQPNVWIGFDACILPGVTIGEGSIIGARSVVISDVAPYSIAAGNPARLVRRLDDKERAVAPRRQ